MNEFIKKNRPMIHENESIKFDSPISRTIEDLYCILSNSRKDFKDLKRITLTYGIESDMKILVTKIEEYTFDRIKNILS